MNNRRRMLMAIANSYKWLPYSFEYLYHNLIPSELPTVNLWDEEWLGGTTIDAPTGSTTPLSQRICSKDFIQVNSAKEYYIYFNTTLYSSGRIACYDNNKTYLGQTDGWKSANSPTTITFPTKTAFIKFCFVQTNNAYTNGICINISNHAINGIYFPYKPRKVKDKTRLVKISGNSEVVNQWVGNTRATETINGITFTNNNDGTWTVNGTATAIAEKRIDDTFSVISGHKVLFGFNNLSTGITGLSLVDLYSRFSSTNIPTITTVSSSGSSHIAIRVSNGKILNNVKVMPTFVDLTQEYPFDTPTSINDPRVQNIIAKGYRAKNDGEIKNSVISEIETKGFNIWNEVAEQGGINNQTGEVYPSNERYRSVNFTQIIPNTQYYFCIGSAGKVQIMFYDANYNYLGVDVHLDRQENKIFTTPYNAKYIKFEVRDGGTTYNHDICINRSSDLNGTYLPFATFNIWNEKWVVGTISDTGVITINSSQNQIISADYIPVEENTDYYCYTGKYFNTEYSIKAFFYDENKTFISSILISNQIFTTPTNTKYMTFRSGSVYGKPYAYDICINESNPKKNGMYLPYGVLDSIKLPAPLQLDGALDAHNTFEVTNNAYVFTRNVFDVDLGSLNWGYRADNKTFRTSGIPDIVAFANNEYLPTTILVTASGYTLVGNKWGNNADILNDKELAGWRTSTTFLARDDSYNGDTTNFKNGMNGKHITYTLATPQVISIPRKHLKAVYIKDLAWSIITRGTKNILMSTVSDIKDNGSYRFNAYYVYNLLCSQINSLADIEDKSILQNSNNLFIYDSSCSTKDDYLNKYGDTPLFYETHDEVTDFIDEATCQAGGEINGKQQNIPQEFQEVEYIESDGNQYIDTGIKGNLDSKAELDFALTSTDQNPKSVFGDRSGNNVQAFFIGIDNDYIYAQLDNVARTVIQNPPVDLLRHTISLSKNGYYYDGELKATYSSPTNFTSNNNLYIFVAGDNLSSKTSYKLYSCKIYNNTLIRDFVPCYRKADNVIGLYDKVNGVFYTNAGTGTFLKGNDVDGSYTCEVLPNVDVKFKCK